MHLLDLLPWPCLLTISIFISFIRNLWKLLLTEKLMLLDSKEENYLKNHIIHLISHIFCNNKHRIAICSTKEDMQIRLGIDLRYYNTFNSRLDK